jgi:CYTH domain-containing protein/8-oxo-dGTP pyrophosphatase MutT (NUDIX family)
MQHGTEIERKFLLCEFPAHLEKENGTLMEQGYLSDETAQIELRLRSAGEQCFLTLKKGRGMLRLEEEMRLGKDDFERLWPFTAGARVRKTRYRAVQDGTEVEFDEYQDELSPLVVAEVELPPGADFLGIDLPDWIGTEITGLPEYSNQFLARYGFPDKSTCVPPIPKDNTTRPITHAGVIPYRFADDKLQFLCITSRVRKNWIVPKGVWDAGIDLYEVAAMEAWEEAGITGNLDRKAVGIYEESNDGRDDRIELFALAVEKQENKWPEMSFRDRRWFGFEEALSVICYPGIAALMQKLKASLTAG